MPFDDQILLLPRDRYWEWLQASQPYILTFGPNLTSDPGAAVRYMAPRQVITFPRFDGAFPEIGDPLPWLQAEAPGVRLDPIDAGKPAKLAKALKRRVKDNDRYGARRRGFHLVWPTDFQVVTQPFGVNPQAYRRYGLPGHEGLDFRALTNTNVYAAAEGEVYEVYTDPKHHAYGIHIRIRHVDGYRTVYAHLARALVRKGDAVEAGQLIGRADSTGNSSAAHLHLTLKRDGATARKETNYPKDIIDPTPFLVWPAAKSAKTAKSPSSGGSRIGLSLPLSAAMGRAEIDRAARLGVRTVMIAQGETASNLEALRTGRPGVRLMARLTEAPTQEIGQPARFVAGIAGEVGRLYRLGIRDFEMPPGPNEHAGGFGRCWRDGQEFGAWLSGVARRLREVFPELRPGYPSLAAGGDVIGRQQDAATFLDQSAAAVDEMAWIGVACADAGPSAILVTALEDFPDKPICVTEWIESRDGEEPERRAIRLKAFLTRHAHPSIEAILIRPGGADEPLAGFLSWEAAEILVDSSVF
jgi:murein DD-endopeptidase MepM/ murein hydrolase activator NlpD